VDCCTQKGGSEAKDTQEGEKCMKSVLWCRAMVATDTGHEAAGLVKITLDRFEVAKEAS